jgi:hypothetical protein
MTLRLLAALLVALGAALLGSGCGQRLETFPHRAHLDAKSCGGPGQPRCPTCLTCHEITARADADLRPGTAVCARCHAGSGDPRELSPTRPLSADHSPITFDHARHLELDAFRGQCVRCHAGVVDDGAAGDVFPPMNTCVSGCHADEMARGDCKGCHGPVDLRRLVPRTYLAHDEPFLRDHGLEATRNAAVCGHCHAQTDCTDCHDSTQRLSRIWRGPQMLARELPHPVGFADRHAVEARSAPASCQKCHETSTCEGCHLRRGISAGHREANSPHPPGWIAGNKGSRDFHGRAARLDILSCAACHDQGPATNCIRCHRVGAGGSNPHPGGWRSERSPQEGMCRYCHGN